MRKVLILGATSAIAQATARLFAEAKDRICIVGRDSVKLKAVESDLKTRGADKVVTLAADLNDYSKHADLVSQARNSMEGLDTVLLAYGVLPDQKECEKSFVSFEQSFKTNFLSAASLLTIIANLFENEKQGSIAIISSVAGDRGRKSNYVYGAAKGALSIFAAGLRNRLASSNVQVLTVKPGFVDTPMTKDFKKGALWASPEAVGIGIYKAIESRKDIVYLPWFWWGIMNIIRHIPERIFKKLSL